MSDTRLSPRGIAALPVLAIVLVLGLILAGAAYFATRDQGDTNTVAQNTNGTVINNNTAPSNQNRNASSNANTVATINVPVSGNANQNNNTNTDTTPTGWSTYDSSTSTLQLFRSLDPAFTLSYPNGTYLSEAVTGLIVSEKPREQISATIEWSRSTDSLTDDIIEYCKRHVPWTTSPGEVTYDTATTIQVDGTPSAYLKARLPDFDGHLDPVFVCIPHDGTADLITGQPWSSPFVSTHFETMLGTFHLK